MPDVPIVRAKAADPGVKFELTLNDFQGFDSNKPLELDVSVTETDQPNTTPDGPHTCSMTIHPPYDLSENMVFVLPFGCNKYNKVTKVEINVTAKQDGIVKGTWGTGPNGLLPYKNWAFKVQIKNRSNGRVEDV